MPKINMKDSLLTPAVIPSGTISDDSRTAAYALNLTTAVIQFRTIVVLAPERASLERSETGRDGGIDAGKYLLVRVVIVVDVDEVTGVHVSAGGETVYTAKKT